MESIYKTEIEGLEVEITYEFEEGDCGDDYTPPTPTFIEIVEWKLANGEKTERYNHTDLDDEEWECLMDDIQWTIDHRIEDEILDYEWKLVKERQQSSIERRKRRWA